MTTEIMRGPSCKRPAGRLAYPFHVVVGHRGEERQGHDTAPDALRVRELALPPAQRPVEAEEVHGRIVHPNADSCFTHPRDELAPRRGLARALGALGQD